MPQGTDAGHDLVKMKREPVRAHGTQTTNAILASAAQLLQDVGFERLSTNMISKHAGISPPALYRYFPNKYAVLFELAHSLLIAQRVALNNWLSDGGFGWHDQAEGIDRITDLLARLRAVADDQTGAIWIIRAMRAIPLLREVRAIAHDRMLGDLRGAILGCYPDLPQTQMTIPARIVNEIVMMGTELELDEGAIDPAALRDGIARNVVTYLASATVQT